MLKKEIVMSLCDEVTAAVKSVAEAKGLMIVLVKDATIYGGQD